MKALTGRRILVRFADGTTGEVDLSHLAGKGVFRSWDKGDSFSKVRIAEHGAIAWSREVEICPDAVYLRLTGKSPEDAFPALRNLAAHA